MENQKLRDLVINAEALDEFHWVSSIGLATAHEVTPEVMEPLALDSVKEIYTRRSRINSKRGSPIKGFDYLLSMLSATTTESVRIHALSKSGVKYFVFTDPDLSELLGILGPLRT